MAPLLPSRKVPEAGVHRWGLISHDDGKQQQVGRALQIPNHLGTGTMCNLKDPSQRQFCIENVMFGQQGFKFGHHSHRTHPEVVSKSCCFIWFNGVFQVIK